MLQALKLVVCEAFFNRLCIRSSNLFKGYRDQMERERET